MADDVILNTGSGGDTIATEDIAGIEYQRVKLIDGTLLSTTPIEGTAANGLEVDVTRVTGTVTVDGSAVTQPVSGTVTANAGTGTLLVDGSAVTQPISGTITSNAGTGDFLTPIGHTINEAFKESGCLGGQLDDITTTAATENNIAPVRITSQRSLHTTIRASDGTDLSNATNGVLVDLGGNNDVTIAANSSVNLNQIGGTAVVTGGVAGSQGIGGLAADGAVVVGNPVLIGGDDGTNVQSLLMNSSGRPILAINLTATDGSSNTIGLLPTLEGEIRKLGVAPCFFNGTTWDRMRGNATDGQLVSLMGTRTSGGTTIYKNIDVDESEDAIKASAGQVYWIHAMNLSAATLFLKFYDATVATVVVGTTVPDLTFPLATQGDTNGAGFTLSIPNGIAFGTAITVAATTGIADADSGAPGANQVVVNLGFA